MVSCLLQRYDWTTFIVYYITIEWQRCACVYARARMLGRLDGVGSPSMCRMRATEIRWSAFSVGFLAPCTTIVYAAAIRLITSGSKTS